MTSVKNVMSYSNFFFLLFWKFWSWLVCVPSFKLINSSSLWRKKYDGSSFTPIPVRNYSVTEPSDTLNYKPLLKHCILQTILHLFLLFVFVWNKIFCCRNWSVFCFFICFGVVFGVTVLKILCFWCSFYKIMEN